MRLFAAATLLLAFLVLARTFDPPHVIVRSGGAQRGAVPARPVEDQARLEHEALRSRDATPGLPRARADLRSAARHRPIWRCSARCCSGAAGGRPSASRT